MKELTLKDKIEICESLFEKELKQLKRYEALSDGKPSYATGKVNSISVNIRALELYLAKLRRGEI